MWNDSFRSLENGRGWFGCFIINLSFYLWRSSWFTVSFLCPWKTNPCFFIGYLSCDLCYTQNLCDTFHHGVSFILWCSWKLTLKAITAVFQFLKSVFGSHFYKFLTSKVLHNFCFFWSIFLQYAPQPLHKTTLWFHTWVNSEMAVISSNMPFFFICLFLSFVFWLVLN